MSSYDKGDLVRVRGGFANRELTVTERQAFKDGGGLPAGTGVDPDAVTLRVQKPDGTITTYTGGQVTRDSQGIYHVDVSADTAKGWTYRWESTGAGQAAGRGEFVVASEW